MRLIDADALLKELESSELQPTKETDGFIDGWCEGFNTVVDMINNQPTAYDSEKVVAELEKEKYIAEKEMEECIFKALPYHDSIEGKWIGINKAIEIVRKGGV